MKINLVFKSADICRIINFIHLIRFSTYLLFLKSYGLHFITIFGLKFSQKQFKKYIFKTYFIISSN